MSPGTLRWDSSELAKVPRYLTLQVIMKNRSDLIGTLVLQGLLIICDLEFKASLLLPPASVNVKYLESFQ